MKSFVYFLLISVFCVVSQAQTKDYAKWVNPFIGTGGHGHTFPGATMPFGIVQLSPDTRIDNWDGSSGYHYSDDIIYGFSHTHLSGTGIPDGCDILFMPTVGEPQFFAKEGDKSVNGYASKFSHANEKAEPGYYSVKLDDDGILAEMTSTKRVGMHRYTFPRSDKSNITLDLRWRDKMLDSDATMFRGNDRLLVGWRRSSSWAKNQQVFFAAEFSKPVDVSSYERGDGKVISGEAMQSDKPNSIQRLSLRFKTNANEQVTVKVAISFMSIRGAMDNLGAELPGWDFDKVRADAKAAWNKELSKIEVSGGTPEQTTNFYTALYHTMIQPNVFNDVDGRYKGHDGKVHQLPRVSSPTVKEGSPSNRSSVKPPATAGGSDHYTVFSLWDTFRAAHPLYTIIDQRRTVDFINTFIRIYEQGGRLPVWELWGEETDTMIGYHAVSVIADAMAKGIKGFDYEKAYAAAKHSAELDHFGLAAYKRRGYISMEDENESVSKTLEYAYDDWCIAQMALVLAGGSVAKVVDGNVVANKSPYVAEYSKYIQRSWSFQNLFDPSTGFMRPKKNGGFVVPFAPNEVTFGFTEGNSWQYSFFVPHDALGLIYLYGSRDKLAKKLDELFTTDQKLTGREQADLTGLIGQYAHGNEPSHHIPYLYNAAEQPSKTQKYVRRIMDAFYRNSPDGLIGNEDCGQMSAWYVLSAMGFYPVRPGSPTYEIGTPLFKQVKINLESGKSFTIRAPRVSAQNFYVESMSLNGRRLLWETSLKHADIMKGGIMDFQMSSTPPRYIFPQIIDRKKSQLYRYPAVPIITAAERTFSANATVTLSTLTWNSDIFYTLDGSEPSNESLLYSEPITITKDTTVRAIAINKTGVKSLPSEARFFKLPNDWTVKVISPYSTQYTGGGDNAIVDGIRGTTNFASGEWQGVQGKTYEAVVDLQRPTEIKEVGGSFLQVAGPWIWMPDRIEFETSTDGVAFTKAAEIKPGFPQREMTPTIKEYLQKIASTKARYVRVRVFNFGKIPSWHLGAGGDPWIFIDEIIIR